MSEPEEILRRTTSGRTWAEHFLRAVAALPTGELDLSTQAAEDEAVAFVTGWFANAVETGREAGRVDVDVRLGECEAALDAAETRVSELLAENAWLRRRPD